MAEFDIMPYKSANGGHFVIQVGRVDATASYLQGEIVAFDTDGSVIESGDEPDTTNAAPGTAGAMGIAMAGAASLGTSMSSDGTQATAETEGVQMPFVRFNRSDEYAVQAARFTEANDTTFDGAVAGSDIGDICSLRTDGTDWGICTNASSASRFFRIIKLIDANGEDAVAKSTTVEKIIIRMDV